MSSAAAPAATDPTVLDDLRSRLRRTRRIAAVGDGWELGTDPDHLTGLLADWAEFDWPTIERGLLDRPWVRGAGAGVRALHHRAGGAGERPAVVLLHGWPDSFLRFDRVVPLLVGDGVDVVVPCLPGYPYSESAGMSGAAMAEPIAAVMAELGYRRYVVSGGDIGTQVAESLARRYPDRVSALHLTDIPWRPLLAVDRDDRTPDEQHYLDRVSRFKDAEGAYAAEQATKPDTLAVGLGDSPAGLAAWIIEKLRTWSDCGGEVEAAFPRPDLLTWLTLYWVTGAIGTSFTPYARRGTPAAGRVTVPLVATVFPGDLYPATRRAAERFFDVRDWQEPGRGGHFGAWECPEAFAAGVRSAIEAGA
ncbi:alpha/beta fold hydrolase [Nakamurella flava]|uniref:alpha/beta fold hydrolase n=1 Tax=Nakamurella flava TaxID=2576308 RepID=UPI00197C1CEE|nr:alpha/beta fold hydrolase [Nakamurella flava]